MEGLCPMGAEKISQRQMLHTLPMIRSDMAPTLTDPFLEQFPCCGFSRYIIVG